MNHARFVTGTGTDVGKTMVSCLLALRLNANYFKPIQSGTPTDADFMRAVLGPERVFDETYRLTKPWSPNQAAPLDGIHIEISEIDIDDKRANGHLIVEGAGGILSPINERETMLDIMTHLQLPTVVVAWSGLGTITHTLQTVDILKQRRIPISAIILFGRTHARNRADIALRSGVNTIDMDDIKYLQWNDL
jgi:dethiobiotin synthase